MKEEISSKEKIEKGQSLIQEESIKGLSEFRDVPLVEFVDFKFRYGKNGPFALKNISLGVKRGEVILIGGYSGSGKTTLCNAISGRIPHRITGQMGGSVKLLGKDIWEYSIFEISRHVSYVFQNADEQLVNFTVFDEIAFAAENFKLPEKEIKKRVKNIAKNLGISSLLDRSVNSLSGGEKQKVVLASNLVMDPKVIILDEPLAFLDKKGEDLLISTLESLKENNPELTIMIVEHRLRPFLPILSKIVILGNQGKISFVGNPMNYRKYIEGSEMRYLRDESRVMKEKPNKSEPHDNTDLQMNELGIDKDISNSTLIELQNVYYQYPGSKDYVFSDFSLKIEEGEYIGLMGSNGTGKTTLLYLISQMISPKAGRVTYRGKDVQNYSLDEFLPKIGFIFQNPENQIFEHTIYDEILYGPKNFWKEKIEQKYYSSEIYVVDEKMEDLLHLIGEKRKDFQSILEQNPFCLSWGQKRRLNLASIFSYSPEILLIDEPFIGQDVQSVQKILDIVKSYHDKGATIIIISHDRNLLSQHCSRVVNLDKILEKPAKTKNELTHSEKRIKIETSGTQNTNDNIRRNTNVSERKRKGTKSEVKKGVKSEVKNGVKNEVKKGVKSEVKKGTTKEKKKKKKSKWEKINLFLEHQSHFDREKSFLHRLNPMAKLVLLILFTVFLFRLDYEIILVSAFACILIFAKLAKLSLGQFLRQIRWVVYLTIIYIPLNSIFDAYMGMNDEVLFYLFTEKLPVHRIALFYSIRTGMIIINLFSTAVIFTRTTSMKDLQYSLMQAGLPYRLAFSFVIGLRYVPLLQDESHKIKIAQRMRGSIVSKNSSVKQVFTYIYHQLNTLLISILKKAKNTSISIEARGFALHKTRTNLYHVNYRTIDILVLFGGIMLFIALDLLFNGLFFNIMIPTLQ